MLDQNYTTKLLNLEDVIITNVENISEELHIYIELPRKKHICPACGAVTDCVHDYRMQIVKDVPLARNTFLHLRKRRYRCGCGKRFFEENTFLPRYYRVTSRLVAEIISAFRKVVSAKDIGSRFNVSGATAMRYFRSVNFKTKQLPEVVSVDEFKGNSGGQKYNSIITDPQNRKVIDILPNRYENDLIRYFSQFESKNVEVMDLPEFQDCTKAYHNWFNEILNSMDAPWSNGFTEGCNNKTKVLKRVCYGMHNFRNFRNRILFCHT